MKKKRLLLVLLFLLLIAAGVLLISPYPRQAMFGPKIQGVPLCAWQEAFRNELRRNDLVEIAQTSWVSDLMEWLKTGRPERSWQTLEGKDRERLLISLDRDNNPRVRKAVAGSLFGDSQAEVESLLRLSEDGEEDVRETAFEHLTFARKAAKESLPRIVKLLTHPDPRRRIWGIKIINEAEPEQATARSTLIAMLADSNGEVRTEAAIRFSWPRWARKRTAYPALPALAERLKDSDPRCCVEAAYAIWKIDNARTDGFAVFVRELGHKDAGVRELAASRLGHVAKLPDDVVALLGEVAMNDEDENVRAHAVLALRKGGKAAVPILISILRKSEPATEEKALLALANMGTDARPAAPIILQQYFGAKEDDFVPEFVWLVLEAMKAPETVAALEAFLDNAAEYRQVKAIKALGGIGPAAKQVAPKLMPFLQSTSIDLKAASVLALARIGADAEVLLPPLAELFQEANSAAVISTGLTAIDAARELGPRAQPLIPVLLQKLEDGKGREFHAALALGAIGPEAREAVPRLLSLQAHKDPSRRWAAIDALGNIAQDASSVVPALIPHLRDTFQHNRKPAMKALSQFGPRAKAAIPELVRFLDDDDLDLADAAAEALAKIEPARFAKKKSSP